MGNSKKRKAKRQRFEGTDFDESDRSSNMDDMFTEILQNNMDTILEKVFTSDRWKAEREYMHLDSG